jgi:hypothetical protein
MNVTGLAMAGIIGGQSQTARAQGQAQCRDHGPGSRGAEAIMPIE